MIWAVLAVVAALIGLAYHPVSTDEAWSLVVARRMNRGDRLYRDVFYGAGPLAIWIQSQAFRVLRPQGVVVRGLTACYVTAEVTAAVVLVGPKEISAMAVAGIMACFGGLYLALHNHYGHLTAAATLWAAVAVAFNHPLLAGLIVGLGILGRYPVGVLASATLGVVVLTTGTFEAAAGLVGASLIPGALAIVARPTSLRWFIERAVANKTAYLATAGLSPRRWISGRSWGSWRSWGVQAPIVLAMFLVAAAPITGALAVFSRGGIESVISLALSLIGVSIVFPRFDGPHAVAAMALSGPALVMATRDADWLWWIGVIAWATATFGVLARASMTRRRVFRRDVPSLRYLPVRRLRGGVWPDDTSGLPAEVFLLRLDAPLLYACGGIENPTPYDYPAASTFGADGQALVLHRFNTGMPLCQGWHDISDPLTPVELIEGIPQAAGHRTPLGRLLALSGSPHG